MKNISILSLIIIGLSSYNSWAIEDFVDSRVGAQNQVYGVRQVGNLYWQESNASYPVEGSRCHGGGEECSEIGRLYTWPQAQTTCDNANGWRVAMDNDWKDLEMTMGMSRDHTLIDAYLGDRGSDEGIRLKEDPDFGFNQPSGYFARGRYLGLNDGDDRSYFWAVHKDSDGNEIYYRRNIRVHTSYIHRFSNGLGDFAISVRCVKDVIDEAINL